MTHSHKKLSGGLIELSFSVSPEEYASYLEVAAKQLANSKPLEGFRPGKTPYDLIKQRFGELKILETALPAIIKHFYRDALSASLLDVVGEPSVSVTKMAAGNNLEYSLTVAVLPEIKLCDWEKIHISKKEAVVGPEDVLRALLDLRKMQTKEVVVQKPATKKDKIVIDMDMLRDGVAVEGGTVKKHSVYLNEKYYVPGFIDKVVGMSAGETREFNLWFPKEHYQKSIAGQLVDFKVKALGVYELALPETNDEFAVALGQKNIADLKALLEKNLRAELEFKESQRQEIEALEKIIECSRFGDVPEILVNEESQKMIVELERSVTEQGLEFQQYLEQIKKSLSDLKLDFAQQAVKRVKSALVVRAIAKENSVQVSDNDVLEEVTRLINMYKNDAETQQQIRSDEHAEYIKTYLKNRKTIELIKRVIVK